MTPEKARDVYHAARRNDPAWHSVDKPLIQEELDVRAWQAVVDAITREIELEIAVKLSQKISEDAKANE